MVVRNAIARLAVVLMVGTFAARNATAEDCAHGANGKPMATGIGNANPKATNAGVRRLGAEQAAFLDATNKLRKCLGDQIKSVTGWSLAPVRYFDSDPIVEVDVTVSYEKTPSVTVIGSAIASSDTAGTAQSNRVKTTAGAKTMAQNNAKAALKVVFPTQGDTEGDISQRLMGTLTGCNTDSISYWDDGAVSVTLTCGKGAAGANPAGTVHPPPGKH